MKKNMLLNIIAIIIIFSICFSCKNQKQEINTSFPIEKLYMIEYNYFINPDGYQSKFHVWGFSELDKDFKSTCAIYGHDGFYYCNPNVIVPDSLRNRVSSTLLKYNSDTTFLPSQRTGFYDGNYYLFIIQKDNKEVSINFDPKFLPNDLLFLYNYLYGDNKDSISVNKFNELFSEFEKKIEKRNLTPSPLIMSDTLILKEDN